MSMKKIHFFQAKSRLGTPHTPWRSQNSSKGVELAPEYILTEKFLSQFTPQPSVTSFSFLDPDKINPKMYITSLERSIRAFAKKIQKGVSLEQIQVVVGGDHSVTLGSLMAIFKRFTPKGVGYIQIDSHVDLLTYRSSVTKNFHGMFGRVLLDKFDIPLLNHLILKKLPTSNVCYIGNFELDKEEKDFLSSKKIFTLTRTQIRKNKKIALFRFKNFISRFHHIHISFDIDCFDKKFAPATGTPSLSGLYPSDIFPILHELGKHNNISIDLVEVNPKKNGVGKTANLARETLFILLKKFVKK